MANPSRLCAHCTALIPIIDAEHTTRPFHSTWSELEEQGKTCVLCKLMYQILAQTAKQHTRHGKNLLPVGEASISLRVRFPLLFNNGLAWALLQVSVSVPRGEASLVNSFSITTYKELAQPTAWSLISCPLQAKIALIKERYEQCRLYHGPDCEPAAGPLPNRLIQVGSTTLPPRLVRGSEIPSPNTSYATLSHCWGKTQPLRTLSENLQDHEEHIPLDSLPRTFREALAITQALSIPYLWIDSLCIVQNDSSEWEIEASKMKDVYSRSSLNIAACDAQGGTEGCFPNPKDDDENESTEFEVTNLAVKVQAGDIRRATQQSILNERGWVLQEQLLPSRMVFCMRSQLHWQCAQTYQTETGVEFEHNSAICGVPRLRSDSSISNDRMWRIWMEDFSSRKFTKWNDRLPSLAGITEHYQSITGDIPLLGLWRSSLLDDLTWVRMGSSPSSSSLTSDIFCPSWTWLSCRTRVRFDFWQITNSTDQSGIEHIKHSSIIDADVKWTGMPLVSAVASARLVIEGPVIDVSLQVAAGGEKFNPRYFVVGNATVSHGPRESSPIPWSVAAQFDAFDQPSKASYRCLLVSTRAHREIEAYREIFLILEPEAGSMSTPMYRRIGIGCFLGKCVEFGNAKKERVHLV